MAHIAQVEVAIHDVGGSKLDKNKRRKGGIPSQSSKSHGARDRVKPTYDYLGESGFTPLPSSPPTTKNVKQAPPDHHSLSQQQPQVRILAVDDSPPFVGVTKDRRVSPERRKKQTSALHSGGVYGSQRGNPQDRVPPAWNGFKFSAKPPDRDDLRIQLDLDIQQFRRRHPDVYDQEAAEAKSPHLDRTLCHHEMTQHFTPRDRTLPRSRAANLHNPLPHYPFLRANSDHGIHKTRWNIMTVKSDDPDRLRPVTARVTTSHDDFHRYYRSPELEKTMARTTVVEVVRSDAFTEEKVER